MPTNDADVRRAMAILSAAPAVPPPRKAKAGAAQKKAPPKRRPPPLPADAENVPPPAARSAPPQRQAPSKPSGPPPAKPTAPVPQKKKKAPPQRKPPAAQPAAAAAAQPQPEAEEEPLCESPRPALAQVGANGTAWDACAENDISTTSASAGLFASPSLLGACPSQVSPRPAREPAVPEEDEDEDEDEEALLIMAVEAELAAASAALKPETTRRGAYETSSDDGSEGEAELDVEAEAQEELTEPPSPLKPTALLRMRIDVDSARTELTPAKPLPAAAVSPDASNELPPTFSIRSSRSISSCYDTGSDSEATGEHLLLPVYCFPWAGLTDCLWPQP